MPTQHYAVIQTGTTIFGTGESIKAALADALEWLEHDVHTLMIAIDNTNGIDGLDLVTCTKALHEHVSEYGGAIVWNENGNGEICLESEV